MLTEPSDLNLAIFPKTGRLAIEFSMCSPTKTFLVSFLLFGRHFFEGEVLRSTSVAQQNTHPTQLGPWHLPAWW